MKCVILTAAAVFLWTSSGVLGGGGPHCDNPMLIHYARPTFRCYFLHGHGNGLGRVIEGCHKKLQSQLEAVTNSFVALDDSIMECNKGPGATRVRQSTLLGVGKSAAGSDAPVVKSAEDKAAYDKCIEEGAKIQFFLLNDLKNCDSVQNCAIEGDLGAISAAGEEVTAAFEECVKEGSK